jgi:hypothetical protein
MLWPLLLPLLPLAPMFTGPAAAAAADAAGGGIVAGPASRMQLADNFILLLPPSAVASP